MNLQPTPTAQNGRPYLGTTGKTLHRPKINGLSSTARLNFDLLRTAQSLLYRKNLPEQPRRLKYEHETEAERRGRLELEKTHAYKRQFKQHATCWCHRTVNTESVHIKRRVDGGGARLAGVGTCGSVWTCPVCAAKITEARRAELMEGMARGKALGLRPFLLTLTTPHGRGQGLSNLLTDFQKALTSFKNSKTYKGIMGKVNRAGSIRSLEVTWGEENGWHPHTHDLVYVGGDLQAMLDWPLNADDPDSTLRAAWFKALKKSGLAGDSQRADVFDHGIDIRDGTYAAEYVAKFGREATSEGWGLSGELTKSHAKLGKRGQRFTPFQLLQWAHTGDRQAAALFREFAEAFTGKRMLSYSPKLKGKLEVGDIPDEVLASMSTPMPDEEAAGSLSLDDYHEVIRRGAIPDLLAYAASCLTNPDTAQDDLADWMTWLKQQPARLGGSLRMRRHFGSGVMEVYGHA